MIAALHAPIGRSVRRLHVLIWIPRRDFFAFSQIVLLVARVTSNSRRQRSRPTAPAKTIALRVSRERRNIPYVAICGAAGSLQLNTYNWLSIDANYDGFLLLCSKRHWRSQKMFFGEWHERELGKRGLHNWVIEITQYVQSMVKMPATLITNDTLRIISFS